MMFDDNFDAGLDTAGKWEAQLYDGWQYGVGDWGNNELAWYTNKSANVRTEGGNLVITARAEASADALWDDCWAECRDRCRQLGYAEGTQDYGWCVDPCGWPRCDGVRTRAVTSARLRTFKKFSVSPSAAAGRAVVRVEARMRLPAGPGLWPALWMLPAAGATEGCTGCGRYGGWPASGEIDILEGVNEMERVLGTLHYGGQGAWQYKSFIHNLPSADAWRTVALEWEERTMRWFVDGVKIGEAWSKEVVGSPAGWSTVAGGAPANAPFGAGDDFYLLINLAVGGNFPAGEWQRVKGAPLELGAIKAGLGADGKQLLVDFVRVCSRQ